MPVATPKFKITIAPPNDPRFTGLFEELEANIEIEVPDGFLLGGIVEALPVTNIGPVLYNNDWYVWNSTLNLYALQEGSNEIGKIEFFATTEIDDNHWLVCDGRAVSRETYAALYNKVGTVFGEGDGAASFNLPDGRGRVLIGTGTGEIDNGPAAPPTPLTTRAIGDAVGEETHALIAAEVPAIDNTSTSKTAATGADVGRSATKGTAHSIMQPSLALVCCIRFA